LSARLKDRVCVVTGAARGIGLAIAERFGEESARLACVDVSARRLEPAVEDLKLKGYEVRGCRWSGLWSQYRSGDDDNPDLDRASSLSRDGRRPTAARIATA
jgi:NAD(P)-dependent dehydrogenase (short-subunit alcohol dehydrogenase family)